VWVVTGDGDALSIGGNHLIHALRRNVNLTILLFNNRIYGLTKGQYSPTSEQGKITKSTPARVGRHAVQPGQPGVGRRGHLRRPQPRQRPRAPVEILRAAAAHRGTALVEIYQNCPIFNDGAFDAIKDRDQQEARLVHLVDGEPVAHRRRGGRRQILTDRGGKLRFVAEAEAHGATARIVIHDASDPDPSQQFAISRLDDSSMTHVPMGIFRQVNGPPTTISCADRSTAAAIASRRRPGDRRRPRRPHRGQGHLDRGRDAPNRRRHPRRAPAHTADRRRARHTAVGLPGVWGIFPLYFHALKPAGAWEILAHRIVWTMLLCLGSSGRSGGTGPGLRTDAGAVAMAWA
jgi:hypothetical protein